LKAKFLTFSLNMECNCGNHLRVECPRIEDPMTFICSKCGHKYSFKVERSGKKHTGKFIRGVVET